MAQELSQALIDYLNSRCCTVDSPSIDYILQENGQAILQENGNYIIKE